MPRGIGYKVARARRRRAAALLIGQRELREAHPEKFLRKKGESVRTEEIAERVLREGPGKKLSKSIKSHCHWHMRHMLKHFALMKKANSLKELEAGVKNGFRYDTKLLIEPAVTGREIECSVIGNTIPERF